MDNSNSKTSSFSESLASIRLRVFVSALAGVVGGWLAGILFSWRYAPLLAWDVGALVFLVWIWVALRGRDAAQTESLAMREDPGHKTFDGLIILASLASLAAVAVLLVQASHTGGAAELLEVGLGIVSVVISWAMVHTVFTLHYARVFYKNQGGIDFNTNLPPSYSDFAYLAFTIGMTFQVADTNLRTGELRKIVLRHAFLSYLFGTVIVASAISLIVGLGGK